MRNISCITLLLVVWGMTALPVRADNTADATSMSEEERAYTLLQENDFEAAETHCSHWLTQLEQESGSESPSLAAPLNCLGEVYYGVDQLLKAAGYFEQAVKLLEQNSGVFDDRLVASLEGLGKCLSALKQYDASISAYIRAKNVLHRNDGVFTLRQTNAVNRLTELYAWTDKFSAANREQEFLLHAHEEAYGNTPQLTPALRQMANWHMLLRREDLARKEYRRALAILEKAYGPDDLRLVGPLNDIAKSYLRTPRESRVMSGDGTRALKRIISLYANQEYPDNADVARAWSKLGDWYIRSGHRRRSAEAYAQAWQSLEVLNEAGLVRTELFDQPVELEFEARPIADWRRSQIVQLPSGNREVVFSFTVDAGGRVRNLQVVKDEVQSNLLMTNLRDSVRASRYRPRIVDGVPVATENVTKTLKFNFDDAKQEISAGTASDDAGDQGTGATDVSEDESAAPAGEGELSDRAVESTPTGTEPAAADPDSGAIQ